MSKSFRELVEALNEATDHYQWVTHNSIPYHNKKRWKKAADLDDHIHHSGLDHVAQIRGNPMHGAIHLHIHKDHRKHPAVHDLIDRFHKI